MKELKKWPFGLLGDQWVIPCGSGGGGGDGGGSGNPVKSVRSVVISQRN